MDEEPVAVGQALVPTALPSRDTITFARNSAALSSEAQRRLQRIESSLTSGMLLQIIGRPDAQASPNNDLAKQRAIAIQNFLLKQGVLPSQLQLAPDASPNPQPNGNLYPSYVVVTRPVQKSTNIAPAQTAGTAIARLSAFIADSTRSGDLSPELAIRLMQVLLDDRRTDTSVPTQPAPPKPVSELKPPLQKWTLDKALSLRDNLDAWAATEKWNPVRWDVANNYAISDTTVITGNFPAVLQQIADSTLLNICASSKTKRIHITDQGTSCTN